MSRYSPERKEAVLSKLLPPYNLTVAELAREEGISPATLYNWRKQAKLEGRPVPGHTNKSEQWSAEAKLATVIETATLSEAELSEYCRKKGLYPDQVHRWKAESLQGFARSAEQEKALRLQSRNDKKEIKNYSASCVTRRRHWLRRQPCWCCEKSSMRSGTTATATRTNDLNPGARNYHPVNPAGQYCRSTTGAGLRRGWYQSAHLSPLVPKWQDPAG